MKITINIGGWEIRVERKDDKSWEVEATNG